MGLEHFVQGVGESSPEVRFLGHTDPVLKGDPQKANLYRAENRFRATSAKANQTISGSAARDLVGETIFHPALDEIPGISELRESFDPQSDIHIKKALHQRQPDGSTSPIHGAVTTVKSPLGPLGTMFLAGNVNTPSIKTGVVTHEAAHKVLAHAVEQGELPDNIGHNWPMARLHVHVVRNLLGAAHANALKEHYEDMGVHFGRRAI